MAQVGIGAVQGWLKGGPKMAQEQQWRGPMTVQGNLVADSEHPGVFPRSRSCLPEAQELSS